MAKENCASVDEEKTSVGIRSWERKLLIDPASDAKTEGKNGNSSSCFPVEGGRVENKSQISSGTLLRPAPTFPKEPEVGKKSLFLVCSNKHQRQPGLPNPKSLVEQEVGMLSRGDGDGRGAAGAPLHID